MKYTRKCFSKNIILLCLKQTLRGYYVQKYEIKVNMNTSVIVMYIEGLYTEKHKNIYVIWSRCKFLISWYEITRNSCERGLIVDFWKQYVYSIPTLEVRQQQTRECMLYLYDLPLINFEPAWKMLIHSPIFKSSPWIRTDQALFERWAPWILNMSRNEF